MSNIRELEKNDITELLRGFDQGDKAATNELIETVYDVMYRMARGHRARWSGDQTMSPTVIVNEAFIKLSISGEQNWQDRVHFFKVVWKVMRQVLLRHNERKQAKKRGSGVVHEEFDEAHMTMIASAERFAALQQVMELAESSLTERQLKVFECRRLGDLSVEQTARELGVSATTVKRESLFVESWMRAFLSDFMDDENR